ncbi:MAG: YicC family protein [Clostridia bacterium]|nr:YicC family protein [Clostridia bacterium]
MVYSMTGFGRAKKINGAYEVTVDIKSVNHRFFEYSSRISRTYQYIDDKIKDFLKSKIVRGKIEVGVSIADTSDNSISLELNNAYASAYISAMRELGRKYKIKDDIRLSSLTGNNDFFTVKKNEADEKFVTALVLEAAEEALANFMAMRASEGEKLVADIESRADLILEKVAIIEERSPQTVSEYRSRLENKIKELLGDTTIDEQRVLTETAIFADKIAVDEETVRLRSHIASLRSCLKQGGDIGKRLDFIVQEMNRETNTIGSKAQDIEIGKIVVDIKAEIEKIREQIQNIE